MKSSSAFFANLTLILNLSAPGAAKFVNPFALSYNEESSFAFTISSTISKPTRNDGVLLYGSKTISDVGTSTNVPRIKYTPSDIPNAEPTAAAFSSVSVAIVSFRLIVVFP